MTGPEASQAIRLAAGVRVVAVPGPEGERYLVSAHGRRWRIEPVVAQVMGAADGTHTAGQLALKLGLPTGTVEAVLDGVLTPLGLLDGTPPPEAQGPRGRRTPLTLWQGPSLTWSTSVLAGLFVPAVVVVALVAATAVRIGLWWWMARTGLHLNWAALAMSVPAAAAGALLHELGHGAALARYEKAASRVGVGWWGVVPLPFVDVSAAWELPRAQRLAVDTGGVYMQYLFGAGLGGVALAYGLPNLVLSVLVLDLLSVYALNPARSGDGLWLLADVLGLPGLTGLVAGAAESAVLPAATGVVVRRLRWWQKFGWSVDLLLWGGATAIWIMWEVR